VQARPPDKGDGAVFLLRSGSVCRDDLLAKAGALVSITALTGLARRLKCAILVAARLFSDEWDRDG